MSKLFELAGSDPLTLGALAGLAAVLVITLGLFGFLVIRAKTYKPKT